MDLSPGSLARDEDRGGAVGLKDGTRSERKYGRAQLASPRAIQNIAQATHRSTVRQGLPAPESIGGRGILLSRVGFRLYSADPPGGMLREVQDEPFNHLAT